MAASATTLTILPSKLFNLPRERRKAANDIPLTVLHHGSTKDMRVAYSRAILINLIFYNFITSKETPDWYFPKENTINTSLLKRSISIEESDKKSSKAFDTIFTDQGYLNLDDLHFLTIHDAKKQLHKENTPVPPSINYATRAAHKKDIRQTEDKYSFVEEVVLDRSTGQLVIRKKLLNAQNFPQRSYKMLDKCPRCELSTAAFVPLIPFHIQEKHFKGRDFTLPDFKEFCNKEENKAITRLFEKTATRPFVFLDSAIPDEASGFVEAPREQSFCELTTSLIVNIVKLSLYSVALFILDAICLFRREPAEENS
ncbi:MAG: hypothetical protein S4CHLAM37_10200 [Chlamydiia bacterium]|nr:hypothetical protein [Chlamydiia bacterium]